MGETTENPKLENRNVKTLFSHFKLGIYLQLIYCIVAILMIVLPFSQGLEYYDIPVDLKNLFLIDFKPFYYAGKYVDTMLTGVEIFYNAFENGFRCLPLTAILYSWCNLVTYEQAGAIYMVLIYVSNLVTCIYIGKMVKDEYGLRLLRIYLATPIQLILMFAGNDSSFAAMFLILGYYLMKNHKPLLSGLCIALSIYFKPLLLCVVPFLLIIKNRKLSVKDSILQLAGALLPLVPNVLLYFVNPAIVHAFIDVNFGGPLNPTSNSISIPIAFLLNLAAGTEIITPGTVFLVTFLSLEGLLFILYYLRRNEDELDYFKVAVMLAIATFVGSWTHYYLYYSVFAIIAFNRSKNSFLEKIWLFVMFIYPFQMLLSALTMSMPIETLFVVNLVVSIPYVITLVLEYKLLFKRERKSNEIATTPSKE